MDYLENFRKKLQSIKDNYRKVYEIEELYQTFNEIQESKKRLEHLQSQKLNLLKSKEKEGQEHEIWEKCKREMVQM